MKKILKKLISGICIATLSVSMIILPAQADYDIKVLLNGQEISFDVPPQIIDDYTMVPMRAIFEALGYEVEWNQEEQTISALRGQQVIILTVNSTKYSDCNLKELSVSNDIVTSLQNAAYELDIAPVIIDGSTLVPLRAISEMAGCTVDWDGSIQTVNITGKIYSKLDILNEYLINNGTFDNGKFVVKYTRDTTDKSSEYMMITIAHNPTENTTLLSFAEPLKEPIMGYSITHSTIIYLNENPMRCAYLEVGGEYIEEVIPTDFKTPISNGIYRTFPAGNSGSATIKYYKLADKLISAYCNIAFNMFNMYMSKNYINLNAADFGIVLDN